jgi:DNA-binding ferritin-like protein
MASAAASAAHSATESQRALQEVSVQTAAQVEHLAEANRRQQEVWTAIQLRMDQYKNAFAQTERAARDLLSQTAQHVDSHLEVTKRGYGEIVKIADEHFAQATQKLDASVDKLDAHLQDLTESLERLGGKTDGNQAGATRSRKFSY